MGRFAFIGNEYLNTDHIISVSEETADDTIYIELSDGRTLTRKSHYLDEILGENAIHQLVAVDGCYALFSQEDGSTEQAPVKCLAVTEAGTVRALDINGDYCEFMDSATNFEGLVWPGDGI